ncbi:hypothetical protein CO663_14200 [Rhizobium anhuiense]|uniref:hypothetical protein n=1 Tax=Rhizobium anhuiense TaxID=1184720 RepID=UPI000BE86655|nr:hypothetical protein [Rhizobium anhuiense]PDS58045.1 hypothetical protein CO663_14200 [Rhizobium anhuiense]
MRNITIQDVGAFAAFCFSLAVGFYVIQAAGYFSVVGAEFIGIYFDGNLVAGVIEVLPTIAGLTWFIVIFSNIIFSYFEKKDKEIQLLNIFWWSDWAIGLAFSLSFLLPSEKDFLFVKVAFYYLNAFCLIGICYLQIYRFEVTRLFNVAIAALIIYTAIYQGGRLSAVIDLSKSEPRFSISTSEKGYANTVVMKATANGLIIHSGGDVIFYRSDEIKRMSRAVSDIKIMKN